MMIIILRGKREAAKFYILDTITDDLANFKDKKLFTVNREIQISI